MKCREIRYYYITSSRILQADKLLMAIGLKFRKQQSREPVCFQVSEILASQTTPANRSKPMGLHDDCPACFMLELDHDNSSLPLQMCFLRRTAACRCQILWRLRTINQRDRARPDGGTQPTTDTTS